MSKLSGYILLLTGGTFSLFGVIGALVGLPILFVGALVIVRRSLDL